MKVSFPLIIFLTFVYVISFLAGGGEFESGPALPSWVAVIILATTVITAVAAYTVGNVAGVSGRNIAVAAVLIGVGATLLSLLDMLVPLYEVATFSSFGFPFWLQWLIAVPVGLAFVMTLFAVMKDLLGTGQWVFGSGS